MGDSVVWLTPLCTWSVWSIDWWCEWCTHRVQDDTGAASVPQSVLHSTSSQQQAENIITIMSIQFLGFLMFPLSVYRPDPQPYYTGIYQSKSVIFLTMCVSDITKNRLCGKYVFA